MVPMTVDETETFAARLPALAAADGFASSIENLAVDLTVDVIGQAVVCNGSYYYWYKQLRGACLGYFALVSESLESD